MKRAIILLVVSLITLISVNAESIFLSGHMEEGETKVYETEDGVYALSLLSVSDVRGKATFRLNSEMSKGIRNRDSYVFEDGSEIVVRELLISESGEGVDVAYYYFYGTGKDVLKLKNISRYVVENKSCNFDGQCLNETEENCCYDCGCNEGECINNKCVSDEEEKEEVEEETGVKEEIAEEEKKEEVKEEEKTVRKEEYGERNVAYAILFIIVAIIVFSIWSIFHKRNRIF